VTQPRRHRRPAARLRVGALPLGALSVASAVGVALVAFPQSSSGQQPDSSVSSSRAVAVDIAQIQGAGHLSALVGDDVVGVTGVITARTSNGFFMQDPRGASAPGYTHGDSSGIFVFTSSAPAQGLVPRTAVSVDGTVSEYRPDADGLTVTEIGSPSVTTVATGRPLPLATLVGRGGRAVPRDVIDDDAARGHHIDVERAGSFDPSHDGIDFWESLEGMRVRIRNARVVGPTNTSYGETPIVAPGAGVLSARGGIVLRRTDPNPERIVLDDSLGVDVPAANVGDTYRGPTNGVVTYAFDNFHLDATSSPTLEPGGIRRERTRPPPVDALSVATFNVENLAPTDPASKFKALARVVTGSLRSPDLLALEEVQDNSGAADDGTVAANVTLRKLVTAISAAGGPAYRWEQINPVNDAEGGQPGGNIRVAFLIRRGTALHFIERSPGDSTTNTRVVTIHGHAALTHSPGRVQPGNAAWVSTRVPLAGEFRFDGQKVFVIANHWSSKGGDQPLFGPVQPPRQPSEVKRTAQARVVSHFVDEILAADGKANVVVLGDLNDFEYSRSVMALRGNGGSRLVDLPASLPLRQRYTYVYEGNSQVLDHVLLSHPLAARGYRYDVVHVNAEFSHQVSDHDPQVVDLDLGPGGSAG
jgi:predicted extracellular nuclease